MHNHKPDNYESPFTNLMNGIETDYNRQSDIVYEDAEVIAFISPKWWPNNPGNILIVPRENVENVYNITDDLLSKINIVGKKLAIAMKESYGCDGVSFRQHNEPHGGQDVWHFHLHLFPRWENDRLYQLHDEKKFVSPEERVVYAEKIKNYFSKYSV